ncbi:MAG TPA: site-2 protease family protein [Micromonosporaceae bacterium]
MVLFVLGVAISIGLHEVGHLVPAKKFGVKVTQYFVGFGNTVWSRRKGETEYGIKAIPLGGYIRMIGMFPPGDDGRHTARSTSPWRSMIEDARSAAFEELRPGDEKRLFYTRKPWKRVIVMFAGPFMNLILAVAVFLGVLMGFGINTQTTTVSTVSDCVISQNANRTTCAEGDAPSPAKAAGLRPGDRIVAFDGDRITEWSALEGRIRDTVGPAAITVVRDGERRTLQADLVSNRVAKKDGSGRPVPGEYVTAGFLGFSPATGVIQQSFGQSVDRMAEMVTAGVQALIDLPAKIPGLWDAAFGDGEREPDSPVGVVGAARVGGEVFNLDIPPEQRVATMLFLVAGFNLSLFLFNMLPLLPLDGGHIAIAWFEKARSWLYRKLGRRDPGRVDYLKLMPITYAVILVFGGFTLLTIAADIVNPITLFAR